MADITNYLTQIKTATHGEEVRGAIHDAIEQCYEDGRSGAVDLTARSEINQIINRSGGNLIEDILWESDIYCINTFIQLQRGGGVDYSMDNYSYICVYYKVVETAAPEIRWFAKDDFISSPCVISAAYARGLNAGGRTPSIRRIHIRPVADDTTHRSYEVYEAMEWSWDSDANHNGTSTVVTLGNEKLAGVITKITGVRFDTANLEVEAARGEYDTLNERLDAMDQDSPSVVNGTLII